MKIYEYKVTRNLIKEIEDVYVKNYSTAEKVARQMIDFDREQEQFIAIYLDTQFKIKGTAMINIGTINSSVISTRDVIKIALLNGSTSIVVAHNHPSGNLTASQSDIDMTNTLKKAAKLFDIELVDSLILSEDRYTSIMDKI